MAFTWYGNQSESEACRYGALAVIVPLLERMNVMQIIDRHIPADPQAEYTYGESLSLLMAARLYGPTALSKVEEWANDSGADILWDMPVEKMNDDRLGRALDAFFEQRHSILAELSLHVAEEFDVPLDELHYDPTHVLFTGAYDEAQPREPVIDRTGEEEHVRSDSQLQAAHITKGRATDDAPNGSLMVHVGLSTHVDEFGPQPMFGHTIDGNQNGRTGVDEQLGLLSKHLHVNKLTMISDRGTYSVGHLSRLREIDSYAICSAPWREFRQLFEQNRKTLSWKKASYLSIEQQRRRDDNSELPREHYEVAVVKHQLQDDSGNDIPCRALFVYSTADQKVVRKQRQKHIDTIREGLGKTQATVARGGQYSDEASVTKRVNKLFGKKDSAKYFSWQMIKLTKAEQKKLPKPGRGGRIPTHRFEFQFDEQAQQEDEQYDGYSVVVTTVPSNEMSADVVFTKYKQQTYSELINRGFKGPLAVRPVFLHTPERVEALVFLMIGVLMLYYLIQRTYRQSLPDDADIKDQRTTTNTILKAFASYTLLVHHTKLGREVQPTRLTTRQREILKVLGFRTPAQILSSRLPRPPT